MDIEKLKKAQRMAERIEELESNVKQLRHIISEAYVERESYFNYYKDESIEIPKSLFREVSLLILEETEKDLNSLKIEFENL